jgi:hypothetical protein
MALRRNQARLLRPRFVAETAASLNADPASIHVAELDVTDRVWLAIQQERAARRAAADQTVRGSWPSDDCEELRHLAERLRGQVVDVLFLFRALSQDCGAVMLNARDLFDHLFDLVNPDQEEVLASVEGGTCGIHLSLDTERLPGRPSRKVYELELWGDEWLRIVRGERG